MSQVPRPKPLAENDDFLSIDPDNLDLVCMEQPRKMRYWCRQLALARKKVTDVKNKLKLVIAETRTAIRAEPQAFNIEKVTADAVDDAMTLTTAYQDALKALAEAELQEGLLDANVRSLSSMDYQLTNAGELLKLGYWSAPRIDQNTRERYMAAKRRAMDAEANAAAQDSKPPAKKPVGRK